LPVRLFFTAGAQPKKPWTRGMTSITAGKHSLDRGVPSLRLAFERKKWRIPRGDAHAIDMTDTWIAEFNCIAYENGKVESVGEHDDCVMATWMADTAARMGEGVTMVFGGEEAEPENVDPDAPEAEDLDYFGLGEYDAGEEQPPQYNLGSLIGDRTGE